MKTSEIIKMSTEDINKKIEELRNELFDLRMKQSTAALEKTHRINAARKDIARMKSVLSQRKIEEAKKGGNE